VKETDAIFQNLTEVHRRAAGSEDTLRLSCDAKAPVLIGPFSRGGKSRRGTKGADHDFKPWGKLTPFGIFLPDQKELNFYFTSSKVTSDFIVDRLDQWWQGNRVRYPRIRKLEAIRERIFIINYYLLRRPATDTNGGAYPDA
jgi:Rhodopirellula transposase DDE domain